MSRGRVRITQLDESGNNVAEMARNVRRGLLAEPKDLSPWPKYFYDAEGSRLFEAITNLAEYYQTRTELSILHERAREIVARSGCHEILELGSGSASKTRALLDAMADGWAHDHPPRYTPLDVSESALRSSAEALLREYPSLEIDGYIGDFDGSLEPMLNRRAGEHSRKLAILLGGTIGNFRPEARREFLAKIRAGLRAGDHFLLGVDLIKDIETLEAAYNDASGVTERFNKNILRVINNRLAGDFNPDLFTHRATYNAEKERIEMWLDSATDQEVRVSDVGLRVPFRAGEGMRTEISVKFSPASVRWALGEAGLRLVELYTDKRKLFGLALSAPGR